MKYLAKCIETTVKMQAPVQVWGAISNRGPPLQRNVNGNIDSAKYQSDIIHDIEMTRECVVFLQKGYIFYDLAPCHNSKSTRLFLDCKRIPFWNDHGIRLENVCNIMKKEIGNQMPCTIEEMWKRVCEAWYCVVTDCSGRTLQIDAKENCRSH